MILFAFAWTRACELLPPNMNTPQARLVIAAIGYVESDFTHWRQVGGPAHGFWQFERDGGVRGVMNHAHTRKMAMDVCAGCRVPWDRMTIYDALVYNDPLSCAFARLLLYTLPDPLPAIGDSAETRRQYLEAWRPGKPASDARWESCYQKALAA